MCWDELGCLGWVGEGLERCQLRPAHEPAGLRAADGVGAVGVGWADWKESAMLEGWLAGVLQEKLGNYLELSKEQLRMGLWKGDLVLQNIQLKPVEIPDWPLNIVGGQLQKLTIHIPWQSLSSKSAVLTVDELVVVASIRGAITEEDREKAKHRQLAEKRQLCVMPALPSIPICVPPCAFTKGLAGICPTVRSVCEPRRLASEEALLGSAGSMVRNGKGEADDDSELATGGGVSFKRRMLESIMANLVVRVRRQLPAASLITHSN